MQHLRWLQKAAAEKHTFLAKRAFTITLTLCASFTQFSDICKLPRSAAVLEGDYFRLQLEGTKMDIEDKNGLGFLWPVKNSDLCPVTVMKKWLKWPETAKVGSTPLFPKLTKKYQHISYSMLTGNLKTALAGSELPRISSHAMRAGATTDCAERGVPVENLMRAGRWKQASSAEGYVKRTCSQSREMASKLPL